MARNSRCSQIQTMADFNKAATALRNKLSELAGLAAEICVLNKAQQPPNRDCTRDKTTLTLGVAQCLIKLTGLRCFFDRAIDPDDDLGKTIKDDDRDIMQKRLENFDRILAHLQTLAENHVRCPSPY